MAVVPTKKQIRDRDYYLENNEKVRKRAKNYYWKNKHKRKPADPKKVKNRNLRRLYGISLSTYEKWFRKQDGCCAVCKRPQSDFNRALAVDHNHVTGKIRGLLCGKCNRAIGAMMDSIWILKRAVKYLKGELKWQ